MDAASWMGESRASQLMEHLWGHMSVNTSMAMQVKRLNLRTAHLLKTISPATRATEHTQLSCSVLLGSSNPRCDSSALIQKD